MLFLFFVILSLKITIDIEKLEIINSKIRYRAKIKIYILGFIPVFQKKIQKKNLKKIIKLAGEERIRKNKTIRNLRPKITAINADIDYGLKDVLFNIYFYGLINVLVPIFIAKNEIPEKKRKYNIKLNYNKNYFKLKLKMKMEFGIKELLRQII